MKNAETGENRFEGIIVFEDDTAIWARSPEGRPLFRFNRARQDFGVFRSKRMSETEREFCLIMFDKLVPDKPERRQAVEDFLGHESGPDVYCA